MMTQTKARQEKKLIRLARAAPKFRIWSPLKRALLTRTELPISSPGADADALASAVTWGAALAVVGVGALWLLSRFS